MKRLFLLLIWFACSTSLLGQSTNISTLFLSNFKKAELLYNQFAYRNALQLYLYVNEKDTSNLKARQRIADCYFRLGNIDEAEKWYRALAEKSDSDPQYKYQYAQVLSIQGKYADSQNWFGKYLTAATKDPRAATKFEFIYYLSYYLRDSVLYDIKPENYNSDQSDFAPQFFKKGIVFVSARSRVEIIKRQALSALNDDESMLNVYYAPPKTLIGPDARLFYNQNLNSPYHDGPVAFYEEGNRIAFSRSNLVGGRPITSAGRVNLKLYFGRLSDQNDVIDVESFSFNSDNYSISHPWVSPDGKRLFFTSDMPGGFGGTDIYKCELNNNRWMEPVNLGPTINTMGDEFYPYLANDTTLYFSSNGHGGLGGLDNYLTYIKNTSYSLPINLGFPINTSQDDFSLIIDETGRKGLFASNREGGKGYDDIYTFEAKKFSISGKTIDRDDSTVFVPETTVYLHNERGVKIDSIQSDGKGNFFFDLPFDQNFLFTASKSGYSWIDSLKFSTFSRALGKDSLLVPLWKHALFAKGVVYSNEAQDKLPEATVILENLTDHRVDSLITTTTGGYSFLVEPNKRYRVTARKDGFLPEFFELNTTGIYKGDLLNDFVLEEEFLEKEIIQFDFDKWNLKPSAEGPLAQVLKNLRRYKTRHLHIGAYADSRGSNEYNQALSDKRAKAVVDYFISNGIAPERITAIGFGETLLINRCSNGVICPEEEHSKNRRAELKVQISALK